MAFGAAPRCTTCTQAVYHAEQVMGPGRKIYHKPCLKCQGCGKRLDPGGLVEHDVEPYCLRCHTQLFGTRDLRHGNVRSGSSTRSTPSNTPSKRPLPMPPTPTMSKPPTPRTLPPPTEYYTPPKITPSLPATPDLARSPNGSTPITRPNFRDARPISVPYAGKLENFDERGLMRRGDSPRSKVGERILSDDMCWGCEKRVYAAEQLFALGHKWHRGCLRCVSCRTTLDPGKIADRNGIPKCRHCYQKEHGPGGILGKR